MRLFSLAATLFLAAAPLIGPLTARANAQGLSPLQLRSQGYFPFVLPTLEPFNGAPNVSFLNRAPAGSGGFLRAQGEDFVDENGRRVRLWGVNVNFEGAFPSKELAPKVAARLASAGFNSVRFHHFEGYGAPNGIWKAPAVRPASAYQVAAVPNEVDPAQLDKLDFFISELIKRGIYINFNLHVGRKASEREGIENAGRLPDKDKGVSYFDPKVIERNRAFAKLLLTHVNPYTGRAYNAEPGVCAIEVANENSLLGMWLDGKLSQIPQPYEDELRRRWNEWLRERYTSDFGLRRAYTEFNRPLAGPELLRSVVPSVPVAMGMPSPSTLEGWQLNLAGGANGSVTRDEMGGPTVNGIVQPGLNVRMNAKGSVDWAFQLAHDDLPLESGKLYTFSFWARADKAREVSVNLWEDRKPFRWLGLSQGLELSSDWQQYTVGFRPSGGKPGDVRLTINLGNQTGAVQIGDLSLRTGGRLGKPEEWSIRLANVPFIDVKREPIAVARRDFARFLGGIEADEVGAWREFLKNEVGIRVPIWHSQAQFGGWGGVVRETQSDAVDVHVYWKHPTLRAGWSGGWTIENASMAAQPANDPLAAYSLARVPGKPFVVTEFNSGQPLDYGAETLLMGAAHAAHQGWAGVWVFDYHSAGSWNRDKIEGFFQIDSHPLKMATAPLAAMLFRREDVSEGKELVRLIFGTGGEWDETSNTPSGPALGQFTKSWRGVGASALQALTTKTGVAGGAGLFSSPTRASSEITSVFRTDTGQTTRDAKRGLWSVDTTRSKAWAGNWGGQEARLGNLRVLFGNAPAWSAGGLSSLDGQAITQSKRMLLVVAGRAENPNMGWNAERTTIGGAWGDGPVHVESASAHFRLATSARAARVWILDESGRRRREISSRLKNGTLTFQTASDLKTIWFEIEQAFGAEGFAPEPATSAVVEGLAVEK